MEKRGKRSSGAQGTQTDRLDVRGKTQGTKVSWVGKREGGW